MNEYPKWVQRAPDIGAVLCINANEEKKLLDSWDTEQVNLAEAAVAQAQAEAEAAKEAAQVQLKPQGKHK